MAQLVRPVSIDDLRQFAPIQQLHDEFVPIQVFPSQDGEGGDAVRIEYNALRNRYECIKTGGAGIAAGNARSLCHGFLRNNCKFYGNHLDMAVTVMVHVSVSNYSTRTNQEVVSLYLSDSVDGGLQDTPPYPGAPSLGTRYGGSINPIGGSNGEVIVLDARGK